LVWVLSVEQKTEGSKKQREAKKNTSGRKTNNNKPCGGTDRSGKRKNSEAVQIFEGLLRCLVGQKPTRKVRIH